MVIVFEKLKPIILDRTESQRIESEALSDIVVTQATTLDLYLIFLNRDAVVPLATLE